MKILKNIFLSILSLLVFHSTAQTDNNYRIIQNGYEKIQLSLTTDINSLGFSEIQTDRGLFTRLSIDGFYPSSSIGNPELPTLIKMLEVPLCDGIRVRILSKDSVHQSLSQQHAIYPAQPSRSKSDEGPFSLVINENCYSQNSFYGDDLVEVKKSGVARNINLATLYFSPIKYNPVTQEVIIYTEVEIEITFYRPNIGATQQMKELHSAPSFNGNSLVINPISHQRDALTAAPIKYLIVAHSSFRGELDQFIAWKKRKGFIVEIGYTDEANVGTTTTSIGNFIRSHYNDATPENPAPLYVLLVGDVQQVPAFSGNAGSHVTDLYYFTWTGDDVIPDCYYGRFSAQNLSQLTPQIEKTLMYEQYTMTDPSYLDKAVAIAGVDRGTSGDYGYTHGNPVIHYLTNEYLNSSNGYTTVDAFYNPHASTNTSVIANLLKSGVGYANYTAHCNYNMWGDPQFSLNDVAAMTNVEKMGLMIGNCCLSNKFDESECFGEAVLRKGNFSGAVGYIGGSNSTYWNEDYYWAVGLRSIGNSGTVPNYDVNNLGAYDRLFHTHNEPYADWYITNASMMMAGNMAVHSSSSSLKTYYWEIYHLMGDPSVMTWLSQPDIMQVTANNTLFVGTTTLQVQAVPHAYVALTDPSVNLIAAGFADATGNVTLSFAPLTTPGNYELTASAQHYRTYFQQIQVIVPAGPYVVVDSLPLSNGSSPDAGTMINWDISLSNVGVSDAHNVRVEIVENSPYLTLIQSQDSLAVLGTGQQQLLQVAFTGQIAIRVPDQTEIPLVVTVYYDVNQSQSYNFSIKINSPNLIRTQYTVTEITGNGDVNVDPGESVKLKIFNQNNGHLDITNVTSNLQTYYSLVSITPASTPVDTINKGATINTEFSINIDPAVPDGTLIPFYHRLYNSNYQLLDTFYIFIGKAMEDFETNNFNSFAWEHGTYPWYITTSNVFEGTYSARSKQSLGNNRSSYLSIMWTSTVDDSLTFYRKISSEAGYDGLVVYIDSAIVEAYSGEMDWTRASYPISAGTHSFIFRYAKDQYVSNGSDCAWLDFIKFPTAGTIPLNETPRPNVIFTNAQLQSGIIPEIGATLIFDLTLRNIGDSLAENMWCEVQSPSPYVIINNFIDSSISTLAVGDSVRFTPSFTVSLENYFADQTTIPFKFIVHYNNNATDTIVLNVIGKAPNPALVRYDWFEINGNGDGIINPNETYELRFIHSNIGSINIENVTSRLNTNDSLVTILNGAQTIAIMNVGEYDTTTFTINFDANIPDGHVIIFNHDLVKGQYLVQTLISSTITNNSSSINQNNTQQLSIYPNPTNQWLTLSLEQELKRIEIMDITGKVIFETQNINNKPITLNVNHLASGLYIIKATDNLNKIYHQKFIKQN